MHVERKTIRYRKAKPSLQSSTILEEASWIYHGISSKSYPILHLFWMVFTNMDHFYLNSAWKILYEKKPYKLFTSEYGQYFYVYEREKIECGTSDGEEDDLEDLESGDRLTSAEETWKREIERHRKEEDDFRKEIGSKPLLECIFCFEVFQGSIAHRYTPRG